MCQLGRGEGGFIESTLGVSGVSAGSWQSAVVRRGHRPAKSPHKFIFFAPRVESVDLGARASIALFLCKNFSMRIALISACVIGRGKSSNASEVDVEPSCLSLARHAGSARSATTCSCACCAGGGAGGGAGGAGAASDICASGFSGCFAAAAAARAARCTAARRRLRRWRAVSRAVCVCAARRSDVPSHC